MFQWAPNLTYRLKKSLLRTAKGRPALRHREKQRAKPEIVQKSGLVSEFNKMRRWSQNPQNMVKL